MERDTSHTGAPPDLTLQQLVHDIWTTKEELATLLRPSTPEARDRAAHLKPQTRTVLYSRDTIRVYIRYAYMYAVFSNPGCYATPTLMRYTRKSQ